MSQPNTPSSTDNSSTSDPNASKRIDELETYVRLQIESNLNQWSTSAEGAAASSHDLPDTDSRTAFYLALAGNILWALTAFVNPAEVIVIRTASMVGAAVGAGALTQYQTPTAPPAPQDAVRDRLAEAWGALDAQYKAKSRAWATEIDRRANSPIFTNFSLKDREAYIWSQMFTGISYNEQRFKAMRDQFIKIINSAVANFNRQWEWWSGLSKLDQLEYKRKGLDEPQVRFWWDGKLLGPPIKNFFGNMCLEVSGNGNIRVYNPATSQIVPAALTPSRAAG